MPEGMKQDSQGGCPHVFLPVAKAGAAAVATCLLPVAEVDAAYVLRANCGSAVVSTILGWNSVPAIRVATAINSFCP